MNLKWSFIVSASYSYLHDLLYYLGSEDAIFYEEGEEGVDLTQYFSSIHLNHLTNPDEIYSKAFQICSFINGAEFLMHEKKEEASYLRLERLIDIDKKQVVYYDTTYPVNLVDIDFTINKALTPHNNHTIAKVLTAAKSNDFIQNILFMCAQNMDYRAISQALDEVIFFLNKQGTNLQELGFSKKGPVNHFTNTANNYKTLGLQARHGNKKGWEEPDSPMTITEAQDLITKVIRVTFERVIGFNLPFIAKSNFDLSNFSW